MDPIIIVEGEELQQLLTALGPWNVYGPDKPCPNKLSVHVDGEHVKFKINEREWSPPLGKKSEDY